MLKQLEILQLPKPLPLFPLKIVLLTVNLVLHLEKLKLLKILVTFLYFRLILKLRIKNYKEKLL